MKTNIFSKVSLGILISILSAGLPDLGRAADQNITTIAGPGAIGDGGPALEALFRTPFVAAADQNNNVYVADTGNFRVRWIDPATGKITTVCGTGMAGGSRPGGSGAKTQR